MAEKADYEPGILLMVFPQMGKAPLLWTFVDIDIISSWCAGYMVDGPKLKLSQY